MSHIMAPWMRYLLHSLLSSIYILSSVILVVQSIESVSLSFYGILMVPLSRVMVVILVHTTCELILVGRLLLARSLGVLILAWVIDSIHTASSW